MSEKTIKIEVVDLVMLFGTNNKKVEHLSKLFPTLKIIARGNAVKVIGQKKEIDSFLAILLEKVDVKTSVQLVSKITNAKRNIVYKRALMLKK